ncbi:MAG: YraN family protein [Candidatus Peribacteraceae bacterium]|nr:YraN family protein [Candidatus Peribacteraceae bacterium]
MTHTRAIGRQGEQAASSYLTSLGYEIRGLNVRVGARDEIDILAFDPVDEVLVFAEVKARSRSDRDFRPELNVDRRKITALRRAARAWVDGHEYEGGYRIDLLSVTRNAVTEHFKQLSWEDQIC